MNYTKNDTGEIVIAYAISEVHLTDMGNICVMLPEGRKAVGLFSEQTATYTPLIGDFYIDRGAIIDSAVINQTDFYNQYTQVA